MESISIQPQELRPSQPDFRLVLKSGRCRSRSTHLAGYVAPDQVVLCEGGLHSDNACFDAECYNSIFETEYPNALFLGAGNADDIQRDP